VRAAPKVGASLGGAAVRSTVIVPVFVLKAVTVTVVIIVVLTGDWT